METTLETDWEYVRWTAYWEYVWWMAFTALHCSEGEFGSVSVADIADANDHMTWEACEAAEILYLAACL